MSNNNNVDWKMLHRNQVCRNIGNFYLQSLVLETNYISSSKFRNHAITENLIVLRLSFKAELIYTVKKSRFLSFFSSYAIQTYDSFSIHNEKCCKSSCGQNKYYFLKTKHMEKPCFIFTFM